MQREIKFRGKIINAQNEILEDSWIRGSLIVDSKGLYSIRQYEDRANGSGAFLEEQVDPDTICQFTGAYDIEGEELYENDIVEVTGSEDSYRLIEFDSYKFELDPRYEPRAFDELVERDRFVLHGNKFDNPELNE